MKNVFRGVLKAVGGAGKGFASIFGALLALGGVVASGKDGTTEVAACVQRLVESPDVATMVAGLLVLGFGLARKAGAIHQADK